MDARPQAIARPPAGDLVLLGVAVAFISTSAPIIAVISAPALAIAFWRSLLGAGATGLWLAVRRDGELRQLTVQHWRLLIVAGLLLGAHFAAWIPSLRFTSVAASTALVATQPIWAAFMARARGVRVPTGAWVGIGIAIVGIVVITGIDASIDPRHLIGDLLALAAAIAMAAYVTIVEGVRRDVSTPTATFITYSVSTLPPLLLLLILGQPLGGFSARDWLLIVALTVAAQLLGHTLINVVLRSTSATVTSLAILFEVPGAILVAALALGRTPPLSLLPAVALLFVGLVVLIRSATPAQGPVSESPPI